MAESPSFPAVGMVGEVSAAQDHPDPSWFAFAHAWPKSLV